MTNSQLKETEQFFSMILLVTKDGAKWSWPDANEVFVINNKKFYGSSQALAKVSKIVSAPYFQTHFSKI